MRGRAKFKHENSSWQPATCPMASCSSPYHSPNGGFECEFVDSIPESLSCLVCRLPFRDPYLLDCCGANLVYRASQAGIWSAMPYLQPTIQRTSDKKDQRKIFSLKVRCSKKKEGCNWEGGLRSLATPTRRSASGL